MSLDLAAELRALGVALGALDGDGDLRPDWFSDPLKHIRRVLLDPDQRAALLDAIDGLLPEDPDGPDAQGETRHPLLDPDQPAQLYLTLRRSASGEALLGVAAQVRGGDQKLGADVTFQAGLVHAADAGLESVVGTAASPLELNIDVSFDGTEVGVAGLRVDARVAPLADGGPTADVRVGVKLLAPGGGDELTMIDPAHLEDGALAVLAALLQSRLHALAADPDATPELTALAHHLLPALGLGGGLPPLPLDRIGEDADLLRVWLAELLDTAVEGRGQAIAVWLEHVGGLFGAGAPAGTGTQADPWAIRLAALGTGGVDLTFATRTAAGGARELLLGVRLALDSSILAAQAAATLLALPLSGTAGPIVLPSATVDVRAPRDASDRLVEGPPVRLGSARVGAAWDGTTLRPLIELRDVQVEGIDYPVIDLSNVDSATAAIATAIREAIQDALGDQPPGRNLAALAGIVAPAADPASPLIDPAALIADPAREIARIHRTILMGGAQGWAPMLGELAGLLGLIGVGGGGREDDPWRSELAAVGPLSVQLAAWTGPGDPVRLRIGLRAAAAFSPLSGSWLSELITVALPADAPASIELMGGQHGRVALAGPLALTPVEGLELEIGSAEGRFDWQPGGRLAPVLRIAGISLAADPDRAELPQLVLPADGFDPTLPDLGLGVAVADLAAAVRILLSRLAASWGGAPGFTLAGLLGLHARLPGVPADWPLLGPPPGAGVDRLLADPLGPLRTWLGRIATELSADGTPFATHALGWLRSWLQGTLPALDAPDFGAPDLDVAGAGTYDDPWRLALTDAGHTELLTWLEPAGPPASWASAAAAGAGEPEALLDAAARLRAFAPQLRGTFEALVPGRLAGALATVASEIEAGDGVVPLDAQLPDDPAWSLAATLVDAPHHLLPAHPDSIRQVLAQLDAWQPAAERAALFVGPPFADAHAWDALLAAAEAAAPGSTAPGAHFDLRSAPDPALASLGAVTAQAAHYTADLADAGGELDAVTAQVAAVVARIRDLRGGRPVILVAHSTAGLAAHAFAATNPTLVAGLITLGTPHGGAPLSAVAAPDAAEALRAARLVLQSAGEQGSLADAVAHLSHLLDGWQPGPPGAPPIPLRYPLERFAGANGAGTGTGTGGVPAVAIGGLLGQGTFERMADALAALADGAAGTAAPTHIAFGVRGELDVAPAVAGGVDVDAGVRVDAFRIRIAAGAPEPPRAAHRVDVDARISRPGDWLLATPSARLRRMELGLTVERSADALVAAPRARFYDAAISAPTAPLVELADPMAEGLLDAAIGAATGAGAQRASVGDTAGAQLASALDALGVLVHDQAGTAGFSAEALGALRADAHAFLASRLQPALESAGGLLGLRGPVGGPWRLAVPGAPLELEVAAAPWRVGLRTAGGLDLGAGMRLESAVHAGLPAMTVSATARLERAGVALSADGTAGTLALTPGTGAAPITVVPSHEGLAAELARPVLDALGSALASAGLEGLLGPGWSVGSLAAVLRDPGAWLRSSSALGDGTDLDGERVGSLLKAIAATAGAAADEGLPLPGGFLVSAAGKPCTITLSTSPPLVVPSPVGDGQLDVELQATVDRRGHLAPGGRIVADVPLAPISGRLEVEFGLDGAEVALSVTPSVRGTRLARIDLLPHFGGFGPLASDAAATLLPKALDALVDALPTPQPPVVAAALSIAEALDLHGGAGDPTFAGHIAQLRALGQPGAFERLTATGLPQALAAAWEAAGLPGSITPATDAASWSASVASATAGVTFAWGNGLALEISVLDLTAGPVHVTRVSAGLAGGEPDAALVMEIALPDAAEEVLGLRLAPALSLGLVGSELALTLAPLGAGTAGTLAIVLLPEPELTVGPGGAAALIEQWALPLAANVVVGAVDLEHTSVWDGGPTLHDVLSAIGLLAQDGRHVAVPLPDPGDLLLRAIARLATDDHSLELTETLRLQLVRDTSSVPARLGAGLHGRIELPGDAVAVSLRFGEDAPTWIPDPAPAFRLLLVEESTFKLRPALRLAPFGVRVEGPDGAALLDSASAHLGAVAGYGWASFRLDEGVHADGLGAAVDLDDIGLPLSGASGTGPGGGGNPVAASLLGSDSDKGPATDGDEQGLQPGLGLVAFRAPSGDFSLLRVADGAPVPFDQHPLWFGIHRHFGPLAIDQVGFAYTAGPPRTVEVLVDGGVAIAGLTVQVDDLGVIAPLDRLATPSEWQLDLRGLAVGLRAGPVSLAGGLVKREGPPIDYAGIVNVEVAGKGFSAVGAYGRPSDAAGAYTSLFVFVALPFVIGGPPYLFVTGLGGGAGYNRRLIPPADVTAVAGYPLVTAIDGGLVNDPMKALDQLGSAMPPKRGSLWLAAGVRFTSFALVETTAVAYVSLDRGVEVGVLGVSRAAIPDKTKALAAVELAIKARFSSEEGVLSVQAQLTDHSWLLSKDCQLTGGFAFFIWFPRGQFVLTLGGYHPAFAKPQDFPIVPRLGFHWAVSDSVTIKGESYFALTSSCVMAGGRLEAGYKSGGIEASFVVFADFLISWDPFHYDISAGVTVSAGFHKRICFFACVTIDVHISVGASVHLLGPPLHGEAKVDLEICSVTVRFGPQALPPPSFIGWDQFVARYVVAGAQDGSAVSAHAGTGLLVPETGTAPGHPGSSPAEPWHFVGDFSLHTETRMPATAYTVTGKSGLPPLNEVPATLDVAPMNVAAVKATHIVTVTTAAGAAVDVGALTVTPSVGKVPAALWRLVDHPVADATLQNALTGMAIAGASRPVADSQWANGVPPVIRIADPGMVDESTHVPLGLTTGGPVGTALPAEVTAAAPAALFEVAASILGPAGAKGRAAAGIAGKGAPALSLRALRNRRSSPPVIATLATGVGELPTPRGRRPRAAEPAAPTPEPPPSAPLLRGMLHAPMPPAPAPAAAPVTTASGAGGLPRSSPPPPPRRRLRRAAPPRTRGAHRGRATRPTVPHEGGLEVAAGSMHLWDLPAGEGALVLTGSAAARATFLDRAGAPLADIEAVPGDALRLAVPAAANRLAVSCLGEPPPGLKVEPGPGAVTLAAAAPGRPAAVGWQDASLLARVARAGLLCRGASLRLGAPLLARAGIPALIPATAALAGQAASETALPAAVDVVLVILDARGVAVPSAGPRVHAAGGTLGAPPVVVAGGRRLHLFYAVEDREDAVLRISVAAEQWVTAGVVGLRGRADEWAAALTGSRPRQLIADGPLTASGSVTVVHEPKVEGT